MVMNVVRWLRLLSLHVPFALLLAAVLTTALRDSIIAAQAAEPAVQLLHSGVSAYRSGRLEDAVDLWTRAERSYASEGSERGRMEALVRRAEAYVALGFPRKALDDLDRCQEIAVPEADGEMLDIAAVLAGRARASLGATELVDDRVAHSAAEQSPALARTTAAAGLDRGHRLARRNSGGRPWRPMTVRSREPAGSVMTGSPPAPPSRGRGRQRRSERSRLRKRGSAGRTIISRRCRSIAIAPACNSLMWTSPSASPLRPRRISRPA